MNEEKFLEYLLKNNVEEKQATEFITRLNEYKEYILKEKYNINSIPEGKIIEYTEYLVKNKQETILEFLRGLIHYANFSKKYEYIIEIIDIAEGYNAMDNLHQRIAEKHGEEIREEVFKGMTIPPLGVHPDTKPQFTKKIMKRMEKILGEEKTVELLAPCLHGGPVESAKRDRDDFLKLKDIDEFLVLKKKELVERIEKHRDDGTLEYAQYIDDEVVEYVKNSLTITPGKREGDKIIVTKIPYQIQKFLKAEDQRMKRYYSCYCAWVRGAIKKGEEGNISANFCHCSAGYFKQYWDIIFDQSVKVEPIDTPLTGALECKFAVHIPLEFQ